MLTVCYTCEGTLLSGINILSFPTQAFGDDGFLCCFNYLRAPLLMTYALEPPSSFKKFLALIINNLKLFIKKHTGH